MSASSSGAADHWARVGALFEAARDLPPDGRRALLDDCTDDAVRAEAEALLAAHSELEGGSAVSFLDRLDAQRAAALLGGADDISPGDTIGRYRVVRRLGSGGMGVVHLAHDPRLDRMVALKLLPHHLSAEPAARQQFEHEARAASALDHPNIVTVYEIGDAPDGRAFIAMALCEGPTLRDELDTGPLPVRRAITLATQIADGLGAAHAHGVVHRDIKPSNIIVTGGGVARIVDFGVAKTPGGGDAGGGLTPGTIAYMSPEQTRAGRVDARADVWALGVVLYEMLSGRRPFTGQDERSLIHSIRYDDAPPLARLRADAPARLCRIVERCLKRDPAQRPADGSVVAAELRALHDRGGARHVSAVAAALVTVAVAVVAVRGSANNAPQLEPLRVAVAPVQNRSGEAELNELANMAGDWVTHGLWQTGVIQVVPLAPYGIAGDSAGDASRTVARSTGARLLLDASLYGRGDNARLQARVIDLADGRVLESLDPIRASPDAPLEAAEELRRRVQSTLNARLDTQLTHVRAVTRPPVLDAYREYLAGRDRHAARELPAALAHFQRAAALDSTFVLPHATAAMVHSMMGNVTATDSIVRWLDERTDQLDAFTRAHVRWLQAGLAGDRLAGQAAMREAARLAPGSTLVNAQYADETLALGRPRAAVRILDSFEPERGELRGWIHYWQALCAGLHLQGNHRRELREARRARALYPGDPRALLLELHALAALGRTHDVERLLAAPPERTLRGEPSDGALMLAAALELRAHAKTTYMNRADRTRLERSADRLLVRAASWYEGVPAEQWTVRGRYEYTLVLRLLGKPAEARRLLEALATAPAAAAGPSPVGSRGSPHYPEPVTYRGAAGLLAAQQGDRNGAGDALRWLESSATAGATRRASYWRAVITSALGDRDGAAALLRQAMEDGLPYSMGLHNAPELEQLRSHRTVAALLAPRE